MIIVMKSDFTNGLGFITGYENFVQIDTFDLGMGRTVPIVAEGRETRGPSPPSFSEASIKRVSDSLTPLFLTQSLSEERKDYTIKVLERLSANELREVLEVTIENALFSSYSLSAGVDSSFDVYSIGYSKVSMRSPDNSYSAEYDLSASPGFDD